MSQNWYTASKKAIETLKEERSFIPQELFPTIRKWSNTPTADFICVRTRNGVRQFLLTKRAEKPWIGEWFIPGGRIAPGVHPIQGCIENCARELSFIPKEENIHFVGWLPFLNPEDHHGGEAYFTQMTCFIIETEEEDLLKIEYDHTAQDAAWFDRIEKEFLPDVKQVLIMAGFS